MKNDDWHGNWLDSLEFETLFYYELKLILIKLFPLNFSNIKKIFQPSGHIDYCNIVFLTIISHVYSIVMQ